jgi:hypothetical protein
MRQSAYLTAVCLAISSAVSAAALDRFGLGTNGLDVFGSLLAPRATTCGGLSNLTTCGTGHPSDWCCPQKTQCITLNNAGTEAVICCPDGSDCGSIQTISCDVSFQNATKFPTASVHIANLSLPLPACGQSQCCPLGFTCNTPGNGQTPYCKMNNNVKPAVSPSPTPSTASISTTTLGVSTSSVSPSASPATSAEPAKKSSAGKFVAAGLIPAFLLIGLGIFAFLFWRRKKNVRKTISDPILDPQMAARSDFLNTYKGEPAQASRLPRFSRFRPARPTTGESDTSLTPLGPADGSGTPWPSFRNNQGLSVASNLPPDADMYQATRLPPVPKVAPLSVRRNDGLQVPLSSGDYQLRSDRYQPRR